MGDPYIGEIRMFGGNFAPVGWAFCDGRLLPISENEALFILISTTYGGDGETTFALPDLRGRFPIHMGTGPSGNTYVLGEPGGVETVTLTTQQIPSHTHQVLASLNNGNSNTPTGATWATAGGINLYVPLSEDPDIAPLSATAVAQTGSNQPHSNMQPYLAVNFILSLFGIFPSQT